MPFEITPDAIYSAHFPFGDLSNKKKKTSAGTVRQIG